LHIDCDLVHGLTPYVSQPLAICYLVEKADNDTIQPLEASATQKPEVASHT